MIKFFRNIRQKLLNVLPAGQAGNRFSKPATPVGRYLIYAIGEIILVVIGILIALQINNWNENNKTEKIKQDYYNQLLNDLDKDIKFSKETIDEYENNKTFFQNYYRIYDRKNPGLSEILAEILKIKIATKPLSFNSSTIETLQNSGDIKLIPKTIRNKLLDLKRSQEYIIKKAEFLDKGKNEIIQKASLLRGSDELQEKLKNHSYLKEQLGEDLNLKDIILSVEGAHNWKNILEKEVTVRLIKMEKDISELTELIKTEIKK